MKNFLLSMAFIAVAIPFAVSQQAAQQNTAGEVAGTWKSLEKENGQPLAEVTVKKTDNKLTGTVLLRGLVVDGKNISMEFPMADLAFAGKTLSFTLTFSEAGEKSVAAWELLLRSDREARLAIIKDNDKSVEDGPVFVMTRVKAD
jgi:hypothetical protein